MEWLDKLTKEFEDQKALSQSKAQEEEEKAKTKQQQNRQEVQETFRLLGTKLTGVKDHLEKKNYPCKIDIDSMKAVDTSETIINGIIFKVNNTAGGKMNPRWEFDSWTLSFKANMSFDTVEIITKQPRSREDPKKENVPANSFTAGRLDKAIEVFLKRVFKAEERS